jgi:transcriptional regulator with XRE-family HTH domain
MSKEIGVKIRQLRELKGFSQEYMAEKLAISQRAYSKLERNETRVDWKRISQIAELFEMDPMDLVSFDDNLIFNNCSQSGKFNHFVNQIPEKLIEQYENQIRRLEAEVAFLRERLVKEK